MLSEKTIEELYRRYDIPGGLFSQDEFMEDAIRVMFVYRILLKYQKSGECNIRLLVNHIVVLSNVFGSFYLIALREYVEKAEGVDLLLNSALKYMGRLEKNMNYDKSFLEKITTYCEQEHV